MTDEIKAGVTVIKRKNSGTQVPPAIVEKLRKIIEENCHLICNCTDADLTVSAYLGDRTIVLNVSCPAAVLGPLLGARGKHINALRTIAMAISAKNGFRSVIELPFYPIQK